MIRRRSTLFVPHLLLALGLAVTVTGVGAAAAPAWGGVLEGCRLVSAGAPVQTCTFVAHARDEIAVVGNSNWQVRVQDHGMTLNYGGGYPGYCFLEGALGTDHDVAFCSADIRPGDRVTAWLRGPGEVVIGNLVCDHDPLCRGG